MGKKSKAKRRNNNNKSNKPKNVTDTTVTDPTVTEKVIADTVEQVDTPVADVADAVVETNESETANVPDAAETETSVVQEDAKPDETAEKESDETVKDENPVEIENDVTEEVEQEAPIQETEKEEEIVEQEPSIEEPSTDEATPDVESSDPRPIVIAGPSGAGKGTLINILMKKFPNDQFGFSVSHTTRNPREGEVNGVHYNFSTVDAMKEEIDQGKFIEYAQVHGNYYGTSVEAVRSVQSKGQVCILDIDCQGVRNVKSSSLDPYYIFIAPPSMQDLENRLRGRGTEKEEDIVKRLANAQGEMDYGQEEGNFDKYLVNGDLKTSSEELCSIIQSWYPHLVPDETPEEKEEAAVEEAAGEEKEEETVEQTEMEEVEEELQDEVAPEDEINMDVSEATTEVVDNCSLENEETNEAEPVEPEVDAPMDEASPSDEEEEVVEEQVEEVKETIVEEEHPEDECEKVDVPQSPEPVAETKVEDAKVIETSTPEPVEVKTAVTDAPKEIKEEPKEEPKSIPKDETKEVVADVNPNKTYYTLEELKTPIDCVDWAHRENFLSDEDIQTHFGMNRDELSKLPKWKKQTAKKKLGIF